MKSWLIALTWLLCGAAHAAVHHGVSAGGGVIPGAGWGGVANTTPLTQQGNPADYGYADAVIARWDTVPFQTIDAGQTLVLGVLAFHAPSAGEYAGGVTSNVAYCQVAVDGGAWVSQSAFSTNSQTGVSEYLFRINASDYATDGQHEARAQCVPTTGAPIVLQGPSGYGGANSSISGGVLTVVSAISGGAYQIGQSIMGPNVANNTRISGDSSSGATACNGSPCTGSGDTGTYALNINNGTLGPYTMNNGDAHSFFFSTNKNGTLPETKVYFSAAGNDSNPGTSASPVLTAQHAYDVAHASQSDVGGAVLCAQAGSYALGSGSGNNYNSATRWLNVQATDFVPSVGPRCDGVNAGPVTFTTGARFDTPKQHLGGITLTRQFLTDSQTVNGVYPSFWLEGSAFVGKGMNEADNFQVFSNAKGGGFCTETTITNNQNGCVFAALNRNVSLSYISSDIYQYSRMIVGGTVTHNDPVMGSGTTTNGSKIVTGFPDTARVAVGGCMLATGVAIGNTVASIDSPTQFSLTSNATASGTVPFTTADCAGNPEHPDVMQTGSISNGIVYNVTANDVSNTGQGFFQDDKLTNYAVVNYKGFTGAGGYNLTLGDFVQNLFMLNSTWGVNTRTVSSPVFVDASMVNNTCTSTLGGTNAGLTKRGGTC